MLLFIHQLPGTHWIVAPPEGWVRQIGHFVTGYWRTSQMLPARHDGCGSMDTGQPPQKTLHRVEVGQVLVVRT